jgi:hypothetical protein
MVSTRGHPKEFPEPDLTPTRSTPSTPSKSSRSRGVRKGTWAHTPSNLAIIWLFISLPLVAWDTGYVLLRPLTMPGGKLHWPLYLNLRPLHSHSTDRSSVMSLTSCMGGWTTSMVGRRSMSTMGSRQRKAC